MKLVLPSVRNDGLQAVIVNTAGGITGGDRMSLSADVGAGASLTLTTQAAERVYRANGAEVGEVETHLTVGDAGLLRWLPQELILFERSALRRKLRIDLTLTAQFLMVESVVFGRAAMGEKLHDVNFHDQIAIYRDGSPLYLDGMRLTGDAAAQLMRPAVGGGAGAMASLVLVAPNASAQLNAIRAFLPNAAGASLLADDVLVLRVVAADSYVLRQTLIPVLTHLTDNQLPAVWRL
ncbi:MAG: urease accessory protein [Yoonia sp.]|jgi:urease accessory protein